MKKISGYIFSLKLLKMTKRGSPNPKKKKKEKKKKKKNQKKKILGKKMVGLIIK
jgi:hypothetical protein